MKMFNEKHIGKLIILNSCLIAFLMWGGTVGHFLWDSQQNIKQDLLKLEEEYILAQKNSVRQSVLDFTKRIESRRQFASAELRHTLQDHVEQIHELATTLYQQHKADSDAEHLQKHIVEAIRPFTFNNGRGYFFIRSMSGRSILCPPKPSSEGRNITDNATANRLQVFESMVHIVRNQGSGFNEYLWPKSGGDKEQLFLKISYVKYFAPFDWFIGAGDYVIDVEHDIQEHVLSVLKQSSKQVQNEYFFIYDLHNIEGGKDFATMLINPNRPDLVGKLLSDDYQDVKGKEFRKEMLAGIRHHGEIFVKYWYKKPGISEPLAKMSYFKYYPQWNWVVSRGFYFDDLNSQIAARKVLQQDLVKDQVRDSLSILCFFLLGALLVSLFFSHKVRTIFQTYRLHLGKSNEELKKARDEAQNAAMVKGEFLANMSHEIRTPMNGIIGLSELALQTYLSPGQQDYLQKIHSSSLALMGILDGILDLSKIEAGKFTLEEKPFRISKVLQELVDLFEVAAHKKGLQFVVEQDHNIPENLVGDSLRLRQVLVNLLGNAVKFTSSGKVSVKVVLAEVTDLCQVEFMVIDSGIGIDHENIDHIFSSFTQGESSTSRRFGGTGLGLAISHNLVGLMGGTLQIESEPGQGSIFSFTVAFAMSDEDGNLDSKESVSSPADESRWIPDAQKMRLLLVEDNVINQQLAMELLLKTGADIDLAQTGMQALRRIAAHDYDLIFMDIQMPEMDGLTTCRVIRALEQGENLPDGIQLQTLPAKMRQRMQGSRVPIIAMTANVMVEDQHSYVLAGMDGFIGKPFKCEEIYAVLQANLGLTRFLSPQLTPSFTCAELLPENFPDLHVKEGITRLGGNVELYLRLLQDFATEYADVSEKLQQAIETNKLQALKIAHTVKGLAANFGAVNLVKATTRVEQDISTGRSVSDSLHTFSSSLFEVMQAIKRFSLQQKKCKKTTSEDLPVDDETRIRYIDDLSAMLSASDFRAAEQWQKVKPLLRADDEMVEKLEQCINRFEYTAAQQLLVAMKNNNGNAKK